MTVHPAADPPIFFGKVSPRKLVWRTWNKIFENELFLHTAAAAYYALTAFVPFIVVLLTLAVHLAPDVTGESDDRSAVGGVTVEEFRATLSRILPDEAYSVVADEIARIQKQPPVGLLSLGLAVSLWFASGVFGTIIAAMNRIHGVRETRPYWRLTLTAIGITALQAVIVLGSMFMLAVWPEIRGLLGWTTAKGTAETTAEWLIVITAMLLSYSMTSTFGPNSEWRWRWISVGSVVATFALMGSGLLLRVYIRHFGNYDKTYGSLAGVMLLEFWFWVAAMILLVSVQIDKIIDDEQEKQEC